MWGRVRRREITLAKFTGYKRVKIESREPWISTGYFCSRSYFRRWDAFLAIFVAWPTDRLSISDPALQIVRNDSISGLLEIFCRHNAHIVVSIDTNLLLHQAYRSESMHDKDYGSYGFLGFCWRLFTRSPTAGG